mmetsp:Transcript_17153/g.37235  ORF Transcript_17153/g.37235 Transcript_17153/m.37235 type:complete len:217 (-) Transcript_17153:98-748(-)
MARSLSPTRIPASYAYPSNAVTTRIPSSIDLRRALFFAVSSTSSPSLSVTFFPSFTATGGFSLFFNEDGDEGAASIFSTLSTLAASTSASNSTKLLPPRMTKPTPPYFPLTLSSNSCASTRLSNSVYGSKLAVMALTPVSNSFCTSTSSTYASFKSLRIVSKRITGWFTLLARAPLLLLLLLSLLLLSVWWWLDRRYAAIHVSGLCASKISSIFFR